MAIDIRIPGLNIVRGETTLGDVCWSVDHAPSGVMVAWFYDPETAFKAATEFADLADWTSPPEALQQQPGLAAQVCAVISSNGGSGIGELGVYQPKPQAAS